MEAHRRREESRDRQEDTHRDRDGTAVAERACTDGEKTKEPREVRRPGGRGERRVSSVVSYADRDELTW